MLGPVLASSPGSSHAPSHAHASTFPSRRRLSPWGSCFSRLAASLSPPCPCPPSLARLGPLVKTLLLLPSWTACRALSLPNFRRQTGGVPSSHSASFGLLAFPSPGRGASSGLRRHHGRPPSPSPSFLGPYHPACASSPRSQWLPRLLLGPNQASKKRTVFRERRSFSKGPISEAKTHPNSIEETRRGGGVARSRRPSTV